MPAGKSRPKADLHRHGPRQNADEKANRSNAVIPGFNFSRCPTRNALSEITKNQIANQSSLLAATTTTKPTTTTITGNVATTVTRTSTALSVPLPLTMKTKILIKPKKAGTTMRPPIVAIKQMVEHSTLLPQTSLLKIEPFLLSSRRRPSPPLIRRSHSTFCNRPSNHTNRSDVPCSAHDNALSIKRQPFTRTSVETNDDLTMAPIGPYSILHSRHKSARNLATRHLRSKSNISCASNATKPNNSERSHVGSMPSAAIITHQANGICHIARTPQDQEKFPDRINHDRRGLTAIPIYEREHNLRLLSLQHNLINVLHVPGDLENNGQQDRRRSSTKLERKQEGERNPVGMKARCTKSFNRREKAVSQIPLAFAETTYESCSSKSQFRNSSSTLSTNSDQKFYHQPSNCQPHLNHDNLKFDQALPSKSKNSVIRSSQSIYNKNQRKASQLSKRIEAKMLTLFSEAHSKSFDSGTGSSILTTTTDSTNSTNTDEAAQRQDFSVSNKQLAVTYGTTFQNLVFLDLYDNQIERISNLDGLPALSVLLLGKNRISHLDGLASLRNTLRVLDLHGNKITNLRHQINALKELRSLNLAGNLIRLINANDFKGLCNLKELNLKRNRITQLKGFQHLTGLERLWLCHNDLRTVDDMSTISQAINLLEVTIENNPVTLAGDCVSFLVSYLPRLQLLSQKPVTEQVRQAALIWRWNKERSKVFENPSLSPELFNALRREEIISNARTNWELLRSEQNSSHHAIKGQLLAQTELVKIIESDNFELRRTIHLPTADSLNFENYKEESSLGPNIDSCSSYGYGSGIDDDADNDINHDNHDDDKRKFALPREAESLSYARKREEETIRSQEEELINRNSPENIFTECGRKPWVEKSKTTGKTNQESLRKPTDSKGTGECGDALPLGISSACVMALPQVRLDKPDGMESMTVTSEVYGTVTGVTAAFIPRTDAALNPTFPNHDNYKNNSNNNNNRNSSKINAGSMNPTGGQTKTSIASSNVSRRNCMRKNRMRSHTAVGGRRFELSNMSGNQNRQLPHRLLASASASAKDAKDTFDSPSSTTVQTLAFGVATTTTNAVTQTHAITHQSTVTTNTNTIVVAPVNPTTEREREQGSDYLIEICGHDLNVYGQGALRYIDKQWSPAKSNDVYSLNFSYINFNNIANILGRIKSRFPFAEHYVFRETNISCLGQLNALAELQGITSLCIDTEGNAITTKDLWRLYAIYRLSHWGLRWLNGCEINEKEVEEANNMYAGLSDLVLWAMPEVMLQPLLTRLCLDETCGTGNLTAKEWLMKAEKSLRIVVGKEALQWRKTTGINIDLDASACMGDAERVGAIGGNTSSTASSNLRDLRERGRSHLAQMIENAYNAVEKLNKLETLWPSLLMDIVRNTLLDYARLDVYLADLMAEIMNKQANPSKAGRVSLIN